MSLSALTLLRPAWLLALPLLALGLGWIWRQGHRDRQRWNGLIDPHLMPHVLNAPAPLRHGERLAQAGALLCVILALAGPALPHADSTAPGASRVIVLEVGPHLPATVAEQLRHKTLDLLQQLPAGQTALIAYGDEPYLITPPTRDPQVAAHFVPALDAAVLPAAGNRPGRALSMAHAVLARTAHAKGDLLWLTSAPPASARLPALPGGIHLHILHAAPEPDAALAATAQRSGGLYQLLRADDRDLHALLGGLSRPLTPGHDPARADDLGAWLLLPALLLGGWGLRGPLTAGRFAWLPPLLLGLCLAVPPPAEAAPSSRLAEHWRDLQAWMLSLSGDHTAAAARFTDPRRQAVALYRAGDFDAAAARWAPFHDADSLYNRGNALARQGRLHDALSSYEQALVLRPTDPDLQHNADLIRQLLNNPPPSGRAPPPPAGRAPSPHAQEAAALADQWLRAVPDQPDTLLRRKLQREHERRRAGQTALPWEEAR